MMPATIFLQQSGKRLFLLPGEKETPSVTIDLPARKAYPHPSKLCDEHSRRLRVPGQDSNLPPPSRFVTGQRLLRLSRTKVKAREDTWCRAWLEVGLLKKPMGIELQRA